MLHFKSFKIFEADENEEQPLPSIKIKVTFKNTFNYNKIDINDSFNASMQDAINQLNTFMEKSNKEGKVDVAQINAQGFASWVPTGYSGGNNKLAVDRAKALVAQVKKNIQEYFKDKNIKDVKYLDSEIKGSVDFEKSKNTFKEFLEKTFKDNLEKLVSELKRQGLTNVTVLKEVDTSEKYDVQTVKQYALKNPDKVKKIALDNKNAEEIYNALLNSPLYVQGTAKLTNDNLKIEDAYRENTQYAIVEILINEPDKKIEPVKKEKIKANIESVEFEKDVDKPTSAGENAIKKLVEFINNTNTNSIQHFILIGHSEADDELNKFTFNAKNNQQLEDPKNKTKTIFSEAELADLRFILSIARCKTVYNSIKNLDNFKKIITEEKFWMFPAGTVFGDVLKSKNQKIVQIVVITSDDVINTEPVVQYGTELKGPSLVKINTHIRELGYNFGKLIPGLLGIKSFDTPVPNHLELAKSRDKLAAFKKKYV